MMRIFIGATLLAIIAGTAAAQPQTSPAQLPAAAPPTAPPADTEASRRSEAMAKLQAADTDKDGKWSKAEWIAAGRRERGFDFLDADHDGFVTVAELQAGMQRLRAQRGGQ